MLEPKIVTSLVNINDSFEKRYAGIHIELLWNFLDEYRLDESQLFKTFIKCVSAHGAWMAKSGDHFPVLEQIIHEASRKVGKYTGRKKKWSSIFANGIKWILEVIVIDYEFSKWIFFSNANANGCEVLHYFIVPNSAIECDSKI